MLVFLTVIEDAEIRNQLEKVYYAYRKEMWYTARDILHDDHEAEDVVQSAVIKIAGYLEKDQVDGPHNMRGLCFIIVRNLALNILKKKKRSINFSNDEMEKFESDDFAINPEIKILSVEKADDIAKKFSKLKPEYADIIALKHLYDYSNREIATLLDIGYPNVCTRLSRAKMALRKLLEEGE